MLKRYQVLLNGWLADFLKHMGDKYDLSFSETLRLAVCQYYLTMIQELYPEKEFEMSIQKNSERVKNYGGTDEDEQEKHEVMSRIYFKCSKALEFYLEKEKEQDKGKRSEKK